MLGIESNYEYINRELEGNILDFQAHLTSGRFTESERDTIANELKNTAKAFAQEQGLFYLASWVEAEPTSNGVYFHNDATDDYDRYYAGHVEYGHWDRGHKKFIPARPFMRPALYTVAEASMGRVKGAMSSYLDAMWSLTPIQFGNVHGANKYYTRAFFRGNGNYTSSNIQKYSTFNKVHSDSFRSKYSVVRGGNDNNGYTRVQNHWTRG